MQLIDVDAIPDIEFLVCDATSANGELDAYCRGMDKVMEVVKSMPTIEVPQWTPCSERLPDKEGKYLVTDIKTIDIDIFTHSGNGTPMWFLSDNVTAWMPLPEPYQGEGEQDGNQ